MRKGIIAAALIVVLVSGPVSAEDCHQPQPNQNGPADFSPGPLLGLAVSSSQCDPHQAAALTRTPAPSRTITLFSSLTHA